MRSFFFIASLLIASTLYVQAQRSSPVYISGRILSDRDTIELKISFAYDYSDLRYETFSIPVDKGGFFSYTLPHIHRPGRMQLFDSFTNNILFSFEQLVEPGDSIFMEARIQDKGQPVFFAGNFKGRGAAKYNVIQALKQSNNKEQINNEENDVYQCLDLRDSVVNGSTRILDGFRKVLDPVIYQIIKTDIIGTIDAHVLKVLCGYQFGNFFGDKPSREELRRKRNLFNIFIAHISKDVLDPKTLSLSAGYVNFLYEQSKCELVFQNNGDNFSFNALYNYIRTHNSGILREKLLYNCIFNPVDMYVYFGYCDADDYTNCLKNAVSTIHTPWLKKPIEHLLGARGKGAAAFNFTLSADSSGRKISLSDFKGKVVLLDIWAYQCTGCTLFAQAFHKKIYPLFKDDPDFTVISIMGSESSKEKYMYRLRGVVDQYGTKYATYTYPEYTNLFAGAGEPMRRAIKEHYDINVYPTLILIDRHGKIYSTTLPYFNESDSPTVEKLIWLIKKALTAS